MDSKTITILSPNSPNSQTESSSEDLIDVPTLNLGESLVFRDQNFERLKIMLRRTYIESVTSLNELQDNVTHHWDDLLKANGINSHNSIKDWNVIKKFFNFESTLNISDIMESKMIDVFQSMMASIYENIGYEFYAFFKKSVIYPNIPDYFKNLQISHIYEQIIFYEYIYSSSLYSLYHKIRWMIDNEYLELIDLLDDHHLNMWDRIDNVNIKEYHLLIFEYNLSMKDQYRNLLRMINLHSRVLSFNIEDLEIPITLLGTRNIKNVIKMIMMYFDSDNKVEFVTSNIFEFKKLAKTAGKTGNNIGTPLLETYVDYVSINFLMDIIESGYDIGLSNQSKAQIIYRWLVYSSRILKSTNCRYSIISKSNGEIFESQYLLEIYSRDLNIKNMIEPLHLVNIDFGSMLHITLKDNIDMFSIITRNCEFTNISPSIIAYYPVEIMNHISSKTQRPLHEIVKSIRSDLDLNIYFLLSLDKKRLSHLSDVVFKNLFISRFLETNKKVNISNIFSTRIDPMNEDILILHEFNELDQIRNQNSTTLRDVLDIVFYENTNKLDANNYFDHTQNMAILGILANSYYRSLNTKSQLLEKPFENYIEYLASLRDLDRVAPAITEICESMLFMSYHSVYLVGLYEFIDMRNRIMIELSKNSDNEFREQVIDPTSIEADYMRYGIYYLDDNDSDSSLD